MSIGAKWIIAAVVAVSVSGAVTAAELDEAEALIESGAFVDGADLAESLGSAAGYALAANALSAYGHHLAPEDDKDAILARAMALSELAVAADPSYGEAYMQRAHALGRQAQRVGILEALQGGYADRIKDDLDRSLVFDPNLVGAYLSLGAWHSEIVSSAGFMADLLYGANEEDALAAFERALGLAPDEGVVYFEYGKGLYLLDSDYQDQARAALEKAISLAGPNAWGEIVRNSSQAMLAEIDDD